ncbi:MAG: UbiD family decarboxylase, partial [bacterium]|nr:UbiD family decarboxylase [bacterium]
MPFRDIREFIAKLETEGEARRIEEEVDWNLEAGAMLRRSHEANLPAPFFQKVKDYPAGYRLFGGTLANDRRKAIAMEMPPDTPLKELAEEYLRRKDSIIKPVLVNDGPCKENVHVGNEVDLLEFPVPMIHEGDGGRYIGTWHITISRDPNSEWVNWGMYRHMLHDRNTVAIQSSPRKHLGGMFVRHYEPRKKVMEVAIAIGVEPVSSMCA